VITVLVVSPDRPDLAELAARHPSVEVLCARDLEETLEKLGRNRRIDAVLLLAGEEAPTIAEAAFEEITASPPIFTAGGGPPVAGTRRLSGSSVPELLDALVSELSE